MVIWVDLVLHRNIFAREEYLHWMVYIRPSDLQSNRLS